MFTSKADFLHTLHTLESPDGAARNRAIARQKQLTKPEGSLGRLEDLACFMAGWQGAEPLSARNIQIIVFAGNHGVTARDVSSFPPEVTEQMVANFTNHGAAINALANELDCRFCIHALDLDNPTKDISVNDALTEEEVLHNLNIGARAIDTQSDLIIFGEMGIGNTTIASALAAACFGGTGRDWAGPGTGLDIAGINRKADVIDTALARHRRDMAGRQTGNDPVALLSSLGGREIAAIAGGVVAARQYRIPVILDGFVVCASIAPLYKESRDILKHCIAGHRSAEPGHTRILKQFELSPLLDLNMRLGEGTGAALASAIVRAAVATHTNMATFSRAGVSTRGE